MSAEETAPAARGMIESGQEGAVATSGEPAKTLREWVAHQVGDLYRAYARDESAAVARLARLRHGAATDGRSGMTELWAMLASLPGDLVGRGPKPSRSEVAAGHALSLFAWHQQSRRERSMHVEGTSFGQALGRLASATSGNDAAKSPVARRLQTLIAAPNLESVLYQLRGLISQLRAERIGFDYGLLAVDLRDFQSPDNQRAVRLRWSRDFYLRSSSGTSTNHETNDQSGDGK